MLNCKNITEKQYFMKQNTINYTYFGNVYSEIDRSTTNHAANIAGSDTSQIPIDAFFSYNNRVFTLHSLISLYLLKNLGKKRSNKQLLCTNTTINRVWSAIFFFFIALQHPQPSAKHT